MKTIDCNYQVANFNMRDAHRGDEDGYYKLSKAPLKLPAGEYTFSYDYPLSNTASFKHKLTADMNAGQILKLARKDYERIYREEDKSTRVPVTVGKNGPLFNRDRSDGKYGIWGHCIEDLFFEGIKINEKKKSVAFYIGS